jgi:predicted HAD superfamily hydrolase
LKIASFDVFDTCLTRDVGVPTDLFYDLAEIVLPQFHVSICRYSIEEFVAARGRAYFAAQRWHGAEDVTLTQIWVELCRDLGWDYHPEICEAELSLETKHLFPVSTMKAKIEEFRQRKRRIIFVSDSYLPQKFISQLLLKYSFMEPGDGLYVSGEIGKTKRSGALFAHVLNAESVKANQVSHFGDNLKTDFSSPRKLGISAKILTPAALSVTEESLLQSASSNYLARSRLAGSMRTFRVSGGEPVTAEIRNLVSSFLGPFMLGFVAWVLFEAQRDGVKRLYFVARDCQLAWKVAQLLSPERFGVDCRYLFQSRQALYLPLSSEVDEINLGWLRRDYETPELSRVLARLELSFDDVAAEFDELAGSRRGKFVLCANDHWNLFWKCLGKPNLREPLGKLFITRREAAIAYFSDVGLLDPVPWALVDLGWRLSCQSALRALLENFSDNTIRGYYLGLMENRRSSVEAGPASALFYQPPYDRQNDQSQLPIFSNIWLLELVLGWATHSSVHHYAINEAECSPVFSRASPTGSELRAITQVHEATLQFVRERLHLVGEFEDVANVRGILGAIVDRFVRQPDPKALESLQNLVATDELGGYDLGSIVRPFTLSQVILRSLPGSLQRTLNVSPDVRPWLAGSISSSGSLIRKLALFKKHVNMMRSGLRDVK